MAPGTVTEQQWNAVRAAVRTATDRFAALVASAPDPHAAVTADWSVADTAVHLGTIARYDASLLAPGDEAPPAPDLDRHLAATTVDTVSRVNELLLRHVTERDPARLVPDLRRDVDLVLDLSARVAPETPVTWLGGATVSVAGLLAHLSNELLVHGWDVARALRVPWTVAPGDAALFFDLFLAGVLARGYGRLFDGDVPPDPRRIAVLFRSRHTRPVTVVLREGRVSVSEPTGDEDVHIDFDPATLVLMLFGRLGRTRALLTRRVVVRGPRPWLLPAFLRVVRLPDG